MLILGLFVCHLKAFFLITLASGSLIMDLNVHPNFMYIKCEPLYGSLGIFLPFSLALKKRSEKTLHFAQLLNFVMVSIVVVQSLRSFHHAINCTQMWRTHFTLHTLPNREVTLQCAKNNFTHLETKTGLEDQMRFCKMLNAH